MVDERDYSDHSRDIIYALLLKQLYNYVLSKCHDQHRAEDVVQGTMEVLALKYGRLTELKDLMPVAITIAKYIMWDYGKGEGKRKYVDITDAEKLGVSASGANPLASSDNPEVNAEQAQMIEKLVFAIAQLPEPCREIFTLRLSGMSTEDIARQATNGCRQKLANCEFQCRHKLRLVLGKELGGEAT